MQFDKNDVRIIFIPGNGGGSPQDNWFPAIKAELEDKGLIVITEEFPDNDLAPMSSWLPFIINDLKVDEKTILVGHSTGAIAAMRIAEQRKILGSALVGAYHTDLGMEQEKLAGYFDQPWQWNKIQNNQQWCILFASQDDPWIPAKEPRFIHKKLNCEYHEYKNQGHFGSDYYKQDFPELSHHLLRNINGTA
jgi:serine hydrolase